MGDTEKAAEAWRDGELAEKFVGSLGVDGRITVDTRVDLDAKRVEETYTWHRPCAEPISIFMSGDCAAVKQAICYGLLEPAAGAAYKKSARIG